jgi:transposase-like protein
MKAQKVYDEEFMINTVQLILKNKMSITAASKDLEIGKSTLHRWLGLYKTRVSSYGCLKSSTEIDEKDLASDLISSLQFIAVVLAVKD